MYYLLAYLITINALGFLLMRIDKQKARQRKWRIPEATLLGIAVIGGSVGSILGMRIFRHKTRHAKFRFGLPAILSLQIILAVSIVVLLMI